MKYLIAIMLISISSNLYAEPSIYVNTLEDAVSLSEHSDKDILLVFSAEWCGACSRLKNDLKSNHQMSDDLIICIIDIDKNKTLPQEYKVRTIPHYVLIRDNIEIKHDKGYNDPKRFIKWRNK